MADLSPIEKRFCALLASVVRNAPPVLAVTIIAHAKDEMECPHAADLREAREQARRLAAVAHVTRVCVERGCPCKNRDVVHTSRVDEASCADAAMSAALAALTEADRELMEEVKS